MRSYKRKKGIPVLLRMCVMLTILYFAGLIVMITIANTTVHDVIYDNVIGIAQTDQLMFAQELDHWFSSAKQTVHVLATTLSELSNEDDFEAIAQRFVREYDFIENIFIGFSNERLINGVNWPQPEGWLVSERPWYKAATAVPPGQITAIDPYFSYASEGINIAVSTYATDLGGVGATVGAAISLNFILDRISHYTVVEDGHLVLIGQNGEIIAHPSPTYAPRVCLATDTLIMRNIQEMPYGLHIVQQLHSGIAVTEFHSSVTGESYIVLSPMESVHWTLASILSIDAALAPIPQYLNKIIAPFAIFMAMLLIVSLALVTYLIRNMEERRNIEERLEIIFESIPMVASLRDKHNNIVFANSEAIRFFGLSSPEEYSTRFNELSPELQPSGDNSSTTAANLLSHACIGNKVRIEWMHKRLDTSELLPAEVTLVPVKVYDDNYTVAFIRDLREQYKLQKKEREASDRIQLMFDATPLMIHHWARDYSTIECNQSAANFYGFSNKEEYLANLENRRVDTSLKNHEVVVRWHKYLDSIFELGFATMDDFVDIRQNGEVIYAETVGIRMTYNNEVIAVTYGTDVTELKQTLSNMRQAEERIDIIEANTRAKDRFIARMSHEIRTPISAILGIAEIELQRPDLHFRIEESFAKIHDSASILLSIVNDILDLSKIEAGEMSMVKEVYEIPSLISDVPQLHIAYQGSKSIELILTVNKAIPARLVGDSLRIKQVINNLLSNAFKYTLKGTVHMSLYFEKMSPQELNLVISIVDTGLGMTEKQLASLYSEYARFHEDQTTTIGTGLGMPIVYSLVQMMNATIEVKSQPNKGTSVIVKIPQTIADNEILSTEAIERLQRFELSPEIGAKKFTFAPEPMPGRRVLVVDDIDANLYVARGLLMFYDLIIETCTSGRQAIEKIKEGSVYDIIFMDHTMPDLSGTETTQILRSMGYTRPIIVLTANALIGHSEEFLNNGFDGFISKPINTHHLNTILTKYIKKKDSEDKVETSQDNVDSFLSSPSIVKKLRIDFAKTQKDAFIKLESALNIGDAKTAHRLAHSLKGLAGLIYEKNLTNCAQTVEAMLRGSEIPKTKVFTDALYDLKVELNRVLSTISLIIDTAPLNKVFNKEKAALVFDKLEPLLAKRSFDAHSIVEELKIIPETDELISLIENFEFSKATQILANVRKNLKL